MAPRTESTKPLLQDTQSDTQDRNYPSKARQIVMTITILFLLLLSLSVDTMIFPFFPAIAVEKGLSSTEIGVVFSSFDIAKFIASPISGSLLIKWHPKSMLAFGNIMTALACIAFGIMNQESSGNIFLVVCILIRLIAGVGSAMLSVAATSILMKSTSYEPSTIAGLIEATIGFGFTVGCAVGAGLFELVGYTPMFCIFGGVMLGSIPIYLVIVPKVVAEITNVERGFGDLLAIPGCFLVFIHSAMTRLNNTARSTQLSVYMASSFGTSVAHVGLVIAIAAIVDTISCAISAKIINKRYPFHTMIVGWCMTIVFIMFFGPSPLLDFIFHGHRYFWLTVTMFLAMNSVIGLLLLPPYQAALNLMEVDGYDKDSLHTYGMVAGLINSGLSLGSTVGPVVAGAITDALSFPWTITIFDLANVVLVLLMVALLVYNKYTNQPLYTSANDMKEHKEKNLPGNETTEEKINAAYVDRMNKCLNNSKPLTQVYQQQQPLDH